MTDILETGERIRKTSIQNVYKYHYSRALFFLRLWRTGVISESDFKSELDRMERKEYEHVIRNDALAFVNQYRKIGAI